MTTTTKRSSKKSSKPATKQACSPKVKKTHRFPKELLPESATRFAIFDREYVAIPVEDFDEWLEDRILGELVDKRMREPHDIVPFADIEASLNKKKKGK